MHEDGVVTEGGSSTAWIVQGGTLHTRPLSHAILAGITRDVTLELAHELNIPVAQEPFTVDDALAADECLITSATSFILPVTRIDQHVIGNGSPGPISRALRAAYLARAERLTR